MQESRDKIGRTFNYFTRYTRVFICFMFSHRTIGLSSHKFFSTFCQHQPTATKNLGLNRNNPHLTTLCTSELPFNPLHVDFQKPQSHRHGFPILRSRLPALPLNDFRDPRSPSTSTSRSQGCYRCRSPIDRCSSPIPSNSFKFLGNFACLE